MSLLTSTLSTASPFLKILFSSVWYYSYRPLPVVLFGCRAGEQVLILLKSICFYFSFSASVIFPHWTPLALVTINVFSCIVFLMRIQAFFFFSFPWCAVHSGPSNIAVFKSYCLRVVLKHSTYSFSNN